MLSAIRPIFRPSGGCVQRNSLILRWAVIKFLESRKECRLQNDHADAECTERVVSTWANLFPPGDSSKLIDNGTYGQDGSYSPALQTPKHGRIELSGKTDIEESCLHGRQEVQNKADGNWSTRNDFGGRLRTPCLDSRSQQCGFGEPQFEESKMKFEKFSDEQKDCQIIMKLKQKKNTVIQPNFNSKSRKFEYRPEECPAVPDRAHHRVSATLSRLQNTVSACRRSTSGQGAGALW